ncbi:hypothetical protein EDB87DRAFT_1619736 [Lactarius vividus]|nr:hypothetical protein EDB87DRAFT_1619736 [Lactarius vividus]
MEAETPCLGIFIHCLGPFLVLVMSLAPVTMAHLPDGPRVHSLPDSSLAFRALDSAVLPRSHPVVAYRLSAVLNWASFTGAPQLTLILPPLSIY